MENAMRAIMKGEATKEELASFLLALREKGPSIAEITAAARIMRQFALPVKTKHSVILDTCGTGGDKKGTFNISTITAFVVAAAGVIPVTGVSIGNNSSIYLQQASLILQGQDPGLTFAGTSARGRL